ncbi:hypothetical protein MPEAHAMD_4572 [Methylobacterium frigidaeris]|jgi:hypothetical protein|uniref:DUF2474 domain-containing protein n=1 Tax=Methylobacterium frigidaeris TaxID=2038277 RepID=A0AA37M7A6_9HYPH|nr:hypothetical protein MPEAHAMD_4572 [Methylobacterium frigidaeris]
MRTGSTLHRWLWFVGLWAASVGAVLAVSMMIRFWLKH